MDKSLTSTSKFLSLLLRHQPEAVGLALDESGWADVTDLITRCNQHGHPLTKASLEITGIMLLF